MCIRKCTHRRTGRTRARLTTLRSLNWPDNYDELLEDEKTAVQVAQDQANMDNMVTNSAYMPMPDGPNLDQGWGIATTTNSTDTPVRQKPGTEAANPMDLAPT